MFCIRDNLNKLIPFTVHHIIPKRCTTQQKNKIIEYHLHKRYITVYKKASANRTCMYWEQK